MVIKRLATEEFSRRPLEYMLGKALVGPIVGHSYLSRSW
jgi:hypothetical protein